MDTTTVVESTNVLLQHVSEIVVGISSIIATLAAIIIKRRVKGGKG